MYTDINEILLVYGGLKSMRMNKVELEWSQQLTHLQSIRRALPFLPMVEMNWSMIPHGMLAKSCSAFWHTKAFSFRLGKKMTKLKNPNNNTKLLSQMHCREVREELIYTR